MDRARGFYPPDTGSIPVWGSKQISTPAIRAEMSILFKIMRSWYIGSADGFHPSDAGSIPVLRTKSKYVRDPIAVEVPDLKSGCCRFDPDRAYHYKFSMSNLDENSSSFQ